MTGPASIVFLVPVYAGVMMGALGGDPSRVRENEYTLNGFKLVGAPRDLTRIKAMQEYINKKTEKMQHLRTLPEKLQQGLSTSISPMSRRFCSACGFTNPTRGKKKKKANCHRSNSSAASSTKRAAKQNRSSHVSNWCRWGFCRGRNLRGEFKALSEKVEGVVGQVEQVADRVDALEKPQSAAPARLDKPKFGSR